MGRAKEAMMEREDSLGAAVDFLVSVGTLDRCEFHGYTSEGDGDLDRLWPIAMGERKKGLRGRVPWAANMEAREFTDLLKEAFEDNCGAECYGCNKIANE